MLQRQVRTLLVLVFILRSSHEYPNFRSFLPNGDKVQNPCKSGEIWKGVGHINPEGGGPRNPFGLLFQRYGRRWTSNVCDQDSDNDGYTNGEELGDPYCEWDIGKKPRRTTNITHPGICEPVDTPKCREKNAWLKCGDAEQPEDCAALSKPDVRRMTLQFPVTSVPAQETSYFCQIFELPTDKDYHLIGTRPLINNKQVTHHILLFGCNEKKEKVHATSKPYMCGMLAHRYCMEIIGTWTVGSKGDCYHDNEGFRIGASGYQKVAMQIHWNNPERTKYLDSSGLEIYYTAKLRPQDAGMLLIGQENLIIPPHKQSVRFDSVCSSQCTKYLLKGPVNITRAINHMHYLGRQQQISLYRNGSLVQDITDDTNYNYDNPVIRSFSPPITMYPEDEIRTKCVFSSTDQNKTVYYGEGTNDEMCYAFLNYHPIKNVQFSQCTTWKNVEKCLRYLPEFQGKYEGCKWYDFLSFKQNSASTKFIYSLNMTCSENDDLCSDKCVKELNKFNSHPCMKGDIGEFIRFRWKYMYLPSAPEISQVLNKVDSCAEKMQAGSKAPRQIASGILFICLLFYYTCSIV